MIKAVIFDFGGVVNNWQNIILYKDLASRLRLDYNETKETFEKLLIYVATGKMTDTELIKKVFIALKIQLPKDYRLLWTEKYKEVTRLNKEVIRIIMWLKKQGYRVALLSDTEKSRATFTRKKGWYKYFRPTILSYKVGLCKPDKRIYLLTLRKLHLKAEECIFIDDKLKNLNPARKLGMRTILFKNATQLKKNLKEYL